MKNFTIDFVACLCELIDLKGFSVEHDIEANSPSMKRLVNFQGSGWYSYDSDRKMYLPGEFATYSRIKITEVE